MVDSSDAAVAPGGRGVVQFLCGIYLGNQNGGRMRPCFVNQKAFGIDHETWPGVLSGAVGGAYREVIAAGSRLYRCRYEDIVPVVMAAVHAGVMERDQHKLHSAFFVFAEKLGIAEVVANQKSA